MRYKEATLGSCCSFYIKEFVIGVGKFKKALVYY